MTARCYVRTVTRSWAGKDFNFFIIFKTKMSEAVKHRQQYVVFLLFSRR